MVFFEVNLLMGVASHLGGGLPADVSAGLVGRGSSSPILQAQHQPAGRPRNGDGLLEWHFAPQRAPGLHRVCNLSVVIRVNCAPCHVCQWCNLSLVSVICVYCVNCNRL